MQDIVKYLSQWIPPRIQFDGREYEFKLFINHAHYDIRFCYEYNGENSDFIFLVENIDNQKELLRDLKELRERLLRGGYLDGDYASSEGYSYSKYEKWMNGK
jgi:hypothetical protein